MKVYRIYTEWNTNLNSYTSEHLTGFTIYDATGYWLGEPERSAIIEIVDTNNNPKLGETVTRLAQIIRFQNRQESVLVTVHEANVLLI